MKTCSCLTLILACIIYWQAREITRLTAAPDFPFDPELVRHISPIEWKTVILYGEIKIDPEKLRMRPAERAFLHEMCWYPIKAEIRIRATSRCAVGCARMTVIP